jgi:hypothetical protein
LFNHDTNISIQNDRLPYQSRGTGYTEEILE